MTRTAPPTKESGGTPPLSVVMPVHNALPYLDAAIESILSQTFTDFEFVILDDASTDGSNQRLRHWAGVDPRIRLIEAGQNLGPVGSSNLVANAAKAQFVARMDADDLSHPDRLEEQLQLLRDNPDVGVVGSLGELIDASGKRTRRAETWRLAQRSVFVPFAHGAMMYRRHIFDRVGGYRPECEYWEDQDIIVRMAAISHVLVIQRPLYTVRQSNTSTRITGKSERLEWALDNAYRATDAMNRGEPYDDLLAERPPGGKLDPRVFIAAGSVRLWAGGHPRLFRRLLSRGRLGADARTAAALVWTAWASASPASLRLFLLGLLTLRNRLAARKALPDPVVPWEPLPPLKRQRIAPRAGSREHPRGADAVT